MRQLITRIDDDLHHRLKRRAAVEGRSLNAMVSDILRRAVVAHDQRELVRARLRALGRLAFVPRPRKAPSRRAALRTLLLEGHEAVVTSEIARLELASAARAASSGGRSRWSELLARIDADLAEGGPIGAIGLRPDLIFPAAYRLVVEHRLRTLD